MDQELLQKIEEQGRRLDEVAKSVNQIKRYFFWTLVISVLVIMLPLLGLIAVIPQFLSTYSNLGL
jgi:type II secretory pathway component PulF